MSLRNMVAPTGLYKADDRTMAIRWNDGSEDRYTWFALRAACPCAHCVNEWTGAKLVDENQLKKDVRPARLFSVGRYAMGVHWDDGHQTGIYSYDYLKRLGGGPD